MPDLLGHAGGTGQWLFPNRNNNHGGSPNFHFVGPNRFGWPSTQSHLFQSNQSPLNTGTGMLSTWPSLPLTNNRILPIEPVFPGPQINDKFSNNGKAIVSSSSSPSISENNATGKTTNELSPVYKNSEESVDATVFSSFPTNTSESVTSNLTVKSKDKTDKSSLFQEFESIVNGSNGGTKLLSEATGQLTSDTLNRVNNVSTLFPTIKLMNANNNGLDAGKRPLSSSDFVADKRSSEKFRELIHTDIDSKINKSNVNTSIFGLWPKVNTNNGKDIGVFRQFSYNGNTVKGGSTNDTQGNLFQTMFTDLMFPSSMPKSSKHFINLPDSIRDRIEAMNTGPLNNFPNKLHVPQQFPSLGRRVQANIPNINDKRHSMNEVDVIFKRLDLPQFERKHLKLPSSEIQDKLRHVVKKWVRNREAVTKQSKSDSNKTLENKMLTDLLNTNGSVKVESQTGTDNKTPENRGTTFTIPFTGKVTRKPTGEHIDTIIRPNRKEHLREPTSGGVHVLQKDNRISKESFDLPFQMKNNTAGMSQNNLRLPPVANRTFKIANKTINGAPTIPRSKKTHGENTFSKNYVSERRNNKETKNILIEPDKPRTDGEKMVHYSVPELGNLLPKRKFQNSKENKATIEQGKISGKEKVIFKSDDLLRSQFSNIQSNSKESPKKPQLFSVLPHGDMNKRPNSLKGTTVHLQTTTKSDRNDERKGRKGNIATITKNNLSITPTFIPVTMKTEIPDWRKSINKTSYNSSNKYFNTTEISSSALLGNTADRLELKPMRPVALNSKDKADITNKTSENMNILKVRDNESQTQILETSKSVSSPSEKKRMQDNTKKMTLVSDVKEEVAMHVRASLEDIGNIKSSSNNSEVLPINHASNFISAEISNKQLNSQFANKTSNVNLHFTETNTNNNNGETFNLKSDGINVRNANTIDLHSNRLNDRNMIGNKNTIIQTTTPVVKTVHTETAEGTYNYIANTDLPTPLIKLNNDNRNQVTTSSKSGNIQNKKKTKHDSAERNDFIKSKLSRFEHNKFSDELQTRHLHGKNNKIKISLQDTRRNGKGLFKSEREKGKQHDQRATISSTNGHNIASYNINQRHPSEMRSTDLLEKLLTENSRRSINLFKLPSSHKEKNNKAKSSTTTDKSIKVKSNMKYRSSPNFNMPTDRKNSASVPVSILNLFNYGFSEKTEKKDLASKMPKLGISNKQLKATDASMKQFDTNSKVRHSLISDVLDTKSTGRKQKHSSPKTTYSDFRPTTNIQKKTIKPNNDYLSFQLQSPERKLLTKKSKDNKHILQANNVIKDGTRSGINILNFLLSQSARPSKRAQLFHLVSPTVDESGKRAQLKTDITSINRMNDPPNMYLQPRRTVSKQLLANNNHFGRSKHVTRNPKPKRRLHLFSPSVQHNTEHRMNRIPLSVLNLYLSS